MHTGRERAREFVKREAKKCGNAIWYTVRRSKKACVKNRHQFEFLRGLVSSLAKVPRSVLNVAFPLLISPFEWKVLLSLSRWARNEEEEDGRRQQLRKESP